MTPARARRTRLRSMTRAVPGTVSSNWPPISSDRMTTSWRSCACSAATARPRTRSARNGQSEISSGRSTAAAATRHGTTIAWKTPSGASPDALPRSGRRTVSTPWTCARSWRVTRANTTGSCAMHAPAAACALHSRLKPMAETSSDRTLMALLASDFEEAERTPDATAAAERLPSIDARVEMLLRAVHGPQADPTPAQRAAARAQILDAMTADLAEETAGVGAEPRALESEVRHSTAVTARANAGWADIRGRVTESLLKLFAPAGEVFAMRAIRMAAVPLLALLVVGSIWTGMVADRGESDSPGAGNTRSGSTPTTRGLVTPAEKDLKRDAARTREGGGRVPRSRGAGGALRRRGKPLHGRADHPAEYARHRPRRRD